MDIRDEQKIVERILAAGVPSKEDAREVMRALPHLIRTIPKGTDDPFPSTTIYFHHEGTRYRLRLEED